MGMGIAAAFTPPPSLSFSLPSFAVKAWRSDKTTGAIMSSIIAIATMS
jgi:hypothetical protein